MGKISLLLLLLLSELCQAQLDSFPRWNEFSGHLIIKNSDTIIHHYSGLSQLSPELMHDTNTLVNAGLFSSLFTFQIADSLQKEGKLDCSKSIQTYIETFENTTLTVADLINQRTGFPSHIWRLYKTEVLRGTNTFCTKSVLDNECAVDLILNMPNLAYLKQSKTSYSELNLIILVKVLEICSFTTYEELLKKYTKAKLNNSPILTCAESQFINYYGEVSPMNNASQFGLPFVDLTIGHKNLYAKPEDIVALHKDKSNIPDISGSYGFHVEVYTQKDRTVYLFLNRQSEVEHLEADLKTYIRQHLLQ